MCRRCVGILLLAQQSGEIGLLLHELAPQGLDQRDIRRKRPARIDQPFLEPVVHQLVARSLEAPLGAPDLSFGESHRIHLRSFGDTVHQIFRQGDHGIGDQQSVLRRKRPDRHDRQARHRVVVRRDHSIPVNEEPLHGQAAGKAGPQIALGHVSVVERSNVDAALQLLHDLPAEQVVGHDIVLHRGGRAAQHRSAAAHQSEPARSAHRSARRRGAYRGRTPGNHRAGFHHGELELGDVLVRREHIVVKRDQSGGEHDAQQKGQAQFSPRRRLALWQRRQIHTERATICPLLRRRQTGLQLRRSARDGIGEFVFVRDERGNVTRALRPLPCVPAERSIMRIRHKADAPRSTRAVESAASLRRLGPASTFASRCPRVITLGKLGRFYGGRIARYCCFSSTRLFLLMFPVFTTPRESPAGRMVC